MTLIPFDYIFYILAVIYTISKEIYKLPTPGKQEIIYWKFYIAEIFVFAKLVMITGDLKSGDFNCQKKDPICVYN